MFLRSSGCLASGLSSARFSPALANGLLVPLCALRTLSDLSAVGHGSLARAASTLTTANDGGSRHIGGFNFPEDLRATKLENNGGWRSPRVSAMAAARIKKQGILAMAAGGIPEGEATFHGLDGTWRGHKLPKARHARPPKGRSYDLNINARLDKIAEGLKSQEKKQADYKKSLPPKPISEGLLQYVKKNAWER